MGPAGGRRGLRSEYDGFVIGRSHGIYYYAGDAVLGTAIRDEAALVAPYPPEVFQVATATRRAL